MEKKDCKEKWEVIRAQLLKHLLGIKKGKQEGGNGNVMQRVAAVGTM